MLGYSAAASGAGLLPMMGTFAVTSFVAGPLYNRLGPKLIVSLGAAFLAVGIFLLSMVQATTAYDGLIAGMVVLGIGVGLFYSSITTAAVTALDPSRSSLAGGIIYMFQIAGGSIGLGFNTALVVTAGRWWKVSTGRSSSTPCSPSAGSWSPFSSSAGSVDTERAAHDATPPSRPRAVSQARHEILA